MQTIVSNGKPPLRDNIPSGQFVSSGKLLPGERRTPVSITGWWEARRLSAVAEHNLAPTLHERIRIYPRHSGVDSGARPDEHRPHDLKFMQLVVDLPCGTNRAKLIVAEYRHFADMGVANNKELAEHLLSCK